MLKKKNLPLSLSLSAELHHINDFHGKGLHSIPERLSLIVLKVHQTIHLTDPPAKFHHLFFQFPLSYFRAI